MQVSKRVVYLHHDSNTAIKNKKTGSIRNRDLTKSKGDQKMTQYTLNGNQELVSIIDVSKKQTGYGHWKMTVLFSNGETYSATTNDSKLIDEWYQDDLELNMEIIEKAISIVMTTNNVQIDIA